MSDEHENHDHHPHIAAFHIGPTPEQIEQFRAQGVANGHETIAFLESLTVDQLRHVQSLMKQAYESDGQSANYYVGIIGGLFQWKHKVCVVCAVNHDEELEKMSGQQVDAQPPVESGVMTCCGMPVDSAHEEKCPLMLEYGVEPDEGNTRNVMCKGCEQWYPSLEDRMLRKPGPEGCEHCINKAKWG